MSLEVPGFLPAVVWVPRSTSRRPLLVAAHGAGGRPEAHCERWRELVQHRGFVLCVRGAKTNRTDPLESSHHYYPDHLWLGRAIEANLRAFKQAYADYADSDRAVYTGYSQGAVMGALALLSKPGRFSYAIFVEGQQNDWNVSGAAAFRAAGGERVALVCGMPNCAAAFERSRQSLKKGGVEALFRHAPSGGHTYLGAVGELVKEAFEWAVSADPRWR